MDVHHPAQSLLQRVPQALDRIDADQRNGGDDPSSGPAPEANLEFNGFRRAFWQLNADQREVLILVGASGLPL